jgi:bacterioferritin-associated ferredoxin
MWIGGAPQPEHRRKDRLANRAGSDAVIVCSCNVISDHQVRSVTTEGTVRATSEVYRCLGCSAECGRCARTIRRIMDEAVSRASDKPGCCGRR